MSFARFKSGIVFPPIGLARNLKPNLTYPVVGAIVILNESSAGHMAVVTEVWADTFTITEYNYIPCKGSVRELNKNDKDIIGFYD